MPLPRPGAVMPASAPHNRGPAGVVASNAAGAAMRAGRHVTPLAHGATASWLDGGRLFLQHGPINLIVRAGGSAAAVEGAYRALIDVFPDWLGALVEELPRLRSPESPRLALPAGPDRAPNGRRGTGVRGSIRHPDGRGGGFRGRRSDGGCSRRSRGSSTPT